MSADVMKFYLGETPGGVEGDAAFRAGLRTGILETTDENVRRPLTDEEVNDFLAYSGWNIWDMIAARSTEGESGLIPRQEYETVAFVQQWCKFPGMFRELTELVGGPDGVVEMGRTARREVANKANHVHGWANSCTLLGRGILSKLGIEKPDDRTDDVVATVEFMRRVQHGNYGPGPSFASARGYQVPNLVPELTGRFTAEAETYEPEQLDDFRSFNATTELFGFLLHWDCRAGLCDTGPYPLPDGSGFMIVRDHFLHETNFSWADVAAGLPYCVTEAMIFRPDEPVDIRINDIATTFAEPKNYLRHLKGAAVYARDTWDTPISGLRPLDDAERAAILERARDGIGTLYGRMAGMGRDELIMAGVEVYSTDMMRPYAQIAGCWDRFMAEGFLELHPKAQEAYGPLVGGEAMKVLPPVFVLGEGYPPVSRA